MILEKKFENWLAEKNRESDLSAAIRLWDGKLFNLCASGTPKVLLSILKRNAMSVLLSPTIDTLAEAYVNGDIDIEGHLSDVIDIAYSLAGKGRSSGISLLSLTSKVAHTKHADKKSIQFHYDVSDAFYRIWLGATMVYSCAYFENGDESLDVAQHKKIDHVLRKIDLRPGQTLLDIGCGWGELVIRAAREHGTSRIGITLSQNQFETARRRVAEAGLSHRIEIRLQDYRDVAGIFDRITSIGMFEHVGRHNLISYFSKIRSLLADGGWAMNHGITSTDPDIGNSPMVDGGKFMEKYVFPNGELAHLGQVLEAMQQGGLEAYDIESLRRHYAHTLNQWIQPFENNSPAIRTEVDERKFRIWRVYLAGCAYAFEHDQLSLYQIVCRKSGQTSTHLPWSCRYQYCE